MNVCLTTVQVYNQIYIKQLVAMHYIEEIILMLVRIA